MITNQFQEFCSRFDSKHNKDICRESKNSQDQIYSCWSPRVLKKKFHFLTTISWHVTIDLQRVSTLLRVDPILPVSFGVSRVQNFFTGEGRMSRIPTSFTFGVSRVQNFFTREGRMGKIPTSFTCIGKRKNNHLKRGKDQIKKQNTPQRSYSISSFFRVIVR